MEVSTTPIPNKVHALLTVKEGNRSLLVEEESKFCDIVIAAAPPSGIATATFETSVLKSGKPVLIMKSGRTSEGAAAAVSHTGSLAGSDEICDAAFKQAGIIRCENIQEMFNIAIAFAYQPIPKTNKIAIIYFEFGGVFITLLRRVLNAFIWRY